MTDGLLEPRVGVRLVIACARCAGRERRPCIYCRGLGHTGRGWTCEGWPTLSRCSFCYGTGWTWCDLCHGAGRLHVAGCAQCGKARPLRGVVPIYGEYCRCGELG